QCNILYSYNLLFCCTCFILYCIILYCILCAVLQVTLNLPCFTGDLMKLRSSWTHQRTETAAASGQSGYPKEDSILETINLDVGQDLHSLHKSYSFVTYNMCNWNINET
uniref:Uncharacterized protein n=1 Tax=Dicentrarchus labrax TaxID=13489 RepID=A0A8P4KR09_DICLA